MPSPLLPCSGHRGGSSLVGLQESYKSPAQLAHQTGIDTIKNPAKSRESSRDSRVRKDNTLRHALTDTPVLQAISPRLADGKP